LLLALLIHSFALFCIYNFLDIRKELEQKGYKFISHSDTEVILFSYLEWGEKCFEKFNGMFALGIYNENSKKLLLARDRAGEKPLFYTKRPNL
jgi:asparagine synthase (glutamine-hydrolysing)